MPLPAGILRRFLQKRKKKPGLGNFCNGGSISCFWGFPFQAAAISNRRDNKAG